MLRADKTYVGSAAFFTATLPLTLVFLSTTRLSITTIVIVPLLAAILTLVEGVSGGGVDNVVLPVVAAGLLVLAM